MTDGARIVKVTYIGAGRLGVGEAFLFGEGPQIFGGGGVDGGPDYFFPGLFCEGGSLGHLVI